MVAIGIAAFGTAVESISVFRLTLPSAVVAAAEVGFE